MKPSKRTRSILTIFTIFSIICFVYLNAMALVPNETFASSDISEFQAAVASAFPELEVIKTIFSTIVECVLIV